ncbi:MAG: hypothetical protein M3177_04605 [Pseudomonadota bacterium]|nr:hypothetical protein [Pseudomonadota bacterium]
MDIRALTIRKLHASLEARETPEAIAELIRIGMEDAAPRRVRIAISKVTGSWLKRIFGWSAMLNRFRRPVPMKRQLAKARELAKLFLDRSLPEADDRDAIEGVIRALNDLIGKRVGGNSFKHDRLNRSGRRAAGLDLSRRRYSKLFRLATRLEHRLRRLRREESRYRLVLVSKAALAPELSLEDLAWHMPTAAFVAYYAARMKLRSEFTISGQQRPFDSLANALLKMCADDPGTRWKAIAHVFPRADVLARLTEEEKGRLLRRWFDILSEIAEQLEIAYQRTGIDLETMIVKRGNDSSSWNILAGAWNRARDHWIALIHALNLDPLLDEMLPGKVMRLMAADVAAWHRTSGGTVHPDTRVWAELPKPWEVLRGEARCTREQVEQACERHGVDPLTSGWSAPRSRTQVADFRPTPELVHGVSVGNPYVAELFRKAGMFSGKKIKAQHLPGVAED